MAEAGKLEQAMPLLRKLVTLLTPEEKKTIPRQNRAMKEAIAAVMQNKPEVYCEKLKDALALERQVFGDWGRSSTFLKMLAEFYETRGESAAALKARQALATVSEKRLGRRHPEATVARRTADRLEREAEKRRVENGRLWAQARELIKAGKTPQAALLLQKLETLLTPEERRRMAEQQQILKEMLAALKQGKVEDVSRKLKEALALERQLFGDWGIASELLEMLATSYENREKFSDALKAHREIVAIAERRFGKSHPEAVEARHAADLLELDAKLDAQQRPV